MTVKATLFLEPLDTLFFRGGRPLVAGIAGVSTLPSPQTLAGALATALLEAAGVTRFPPGAQRMTRQRFFESLGVGWLGQMEINGPFLARWEPNGKSKLVDLAVPKPANLKALRNSGETTVLLPRLNGLPGWSPQFDGHLPLWSDRARDIDSKAPGEFLTMNGLRQYLGGQSILQREFRKSSEFFIREERTGIAIDEGTWGSSKGKIYSTQSLRMRQWCGFYCEVFLPAEGKAALDQVRTIFWGGERKQVRVERAPSVEWPGADGNRRGKVVLYCLHPAFPGGAGGWLPRSLAPGGNRGGISLKSAAVERPFSVSGWDLAAGGPKPVRFGIDGGSVFFADVAAHGNLPEILSDGDEDQQLGYGRYLKGAWD